MATTTIQAPGPATEAPNSSSAQTHKEPLQLQGALDQYESFDVTPIIGREFPAANLKEWLEAPNSDELLKELAITSKCDTSPRSHIYHFFERSESRNSYPFAWPGILLTIAY